MYSRGPNHAERLGTARYATDASPAVTAKTIVDFVSVTMRAVPIGCARPGVTIFTRRPLLMKSFEEHFIRYGFDFEGDVLRSTMIERVWTFRLSMNGLDRWSGGYSCGPSGEGRVIRPLSSGRMTGSGGGGGPHRSEAAL